jgi:hypothetical protein
MGRSSSSRSHGRGEESQKFMAQQHKLIAETAKLSCESAKLNRVGDKL